MSLRIFHEVFVLASIVMADMYGGWAIHEWVGGRASGLQLGMGIFTLVGGLAMCAYALFFVRKMDALDIH